MDSQSQCVVTIISKQQFEVLVKFTSDIFVVGKDESNIYDELVKLFGSRRVHQVVTVDELNSFKTGNLRAKIVLIEELKNIPEASALMIFSICAFWKVIGPEGKTISVNGNGRYNSFALDCSKVMLHNSAKTPGYASLIAENNGVESDNVEEADFLLYLECPESVASLRQWLTLLQNRKPNAILMHVDVLSEALADPNVKLDFIKDKGTTGILTNVTFYSIGLSKNLAKKIKNLGGQLSDSLRDKFLVIGGNLEEELNLYLHHKQMKWAFVEESVLEEAVQNEDIKIFSTSLNDLPSPPKFHSYHRYENLYLFPDEALCDADKTEFFKLSKEMGFKIARNEDECHGVISSVVSVNDYGGCDNPTRRNIICLRQMKDDGPHDSCSFTHYVFTPQGDFSELKTVHVAGIRADEETKFFIERSLKGNGIPVAWKSDLGSGKTNVFFLDVKFVKDKIQTLCKSERKGILFIKTDFVFQLLSCPEKVSIKDFTVNLSELSASISATNTLQKVKTEVLEHPNDDQTVAVVQPTPELFIPDVVIEEQGLEATSTKRRKLDWNDTDELGMISKIRDLFGLYMTNQLRFANLQLDVGPMFITELRNFPVSDSPITMSITFRADNLKTNTGVVNDFSKSLTRSNQSPIVGGVFYDYTEDLVNDWGRKLFGKLAKVFIDIGFRNIFCRHCHQNEKGMDLFVLLEDEEFDLCSFRTLDNRSDPEVSSAQFCASKFWIPERVIEIISKQSRLHFALTSPHLIIYCGDDDATCFCKKPSLDMCCKLVQHTFHVPENAPKISQKGALAYFQRTGNLSGNLAFERFGSTQFIQGKSSEDLATQLVSLIRRRKWDSIAGVGKVACMDCLNAEGCITVSKIEGITLACYICGKDCLEGVLVA